MSPTVVVRQTKIKYRAEGCRLAAMIILAEPETIGEKAVGDFLLEVPFMTREIVTPWLQSAGVNPWRPCNRLTGAQKDSLARSLTAFWREWKAAQS